MTDTWRGLDMKKLMAMTLVCLFAACALEGDDPADDEDVGSGVDEVIGGMPVDDKLGPCGNGSCQAELGETPLSCGRDCGFCGDAQCSARESRNTCPTDCRCGDRVCEAEEMTTCPLDCSTCPADDIPCPWLQGG